MEEITDRVTYISPFSASNAQEPSTAYCLLFKLFLLRLTPAQISSLLEPQDCVYVRGLGLLYLRYGCPPKDLWSWFQPYIHDRKRFAPSADRQATVTLGEFALSLITGSTHEGSPMPRLPQTVKRNVALELAMARDDEQRSQFYAAHEGLFLPGTHVLARYEEDNTWYKGTIKAVPAGSKAAAAGAAAVGGAITTATLTEGTSTEPLWTVEFDDYGNEELVPLGAMELCGADMPAFSPHLRDGMPSLELLRGPVDAMLEVDRNAAVAEGRNYMRSRVGTIKEAMSSHVTGRSGRGSDRGWSGGRGGWGASRGGSDPPSRQGAAHTRQRSRSPPPRGDSGSRGGSARRAPATAAAAALAGPGIGDGTTTSAAAATAAGVARLQALAAKYGSRAGGSAVPASSQLYSTDAVGGGRPRYGR